MFAGKKKIEGETQSQQDPENAQQASSQKKQRTTLVPFQQKPKMKSPLNSLQTQKIQQIRNKLEEHHILFKKSAETNDLRISTLQTNGESSVYILEEGLFQVSVKVLRMYSSHDLFIRKEVAHSGTFGKIVYALYGDQKYAIKFIQSGKTNENRTQSILKQIFYTKIASCLGVGPQFQRIFGYDCLIFDDGVEFVMEKCNTDLTAHQIDQQTKYNTLRTCLETLHLFQICHCDLKTDNVAWSSKKNKMVLLDFGLTRYIQQARYQKTLTGFVGTVRYTSPEMKKIFLLKSKAKVNLFDNDLYSLQIVLQELKKFKQQTSKIDEQETSRNFDTKLRSLLHQAKVQSEFQVESELLVDKPEYLFTEHQSTQSYNIVAQFYQFRFFCFCRQYQELEKMLKTKTFKQLQKVYSLILLEQWEKQQTKILFTFYQKYLRNQDFHFETQESRIICKYMNLRNSANHITQINKKIQQFAKEPGLSKIGDFWGIQEWMGCILRFIVPFEDFVQKQKERTKIISDLYCRFVPGSLQGDKQDRNFYKEAHFVLNQFLMYYLKQIKKKPSRIIEIHATIITIKSCFIIIGDFGRNQLIELQILNYLSQYPELQMNNIFQFFLEKTLVYQKQTFSLTHRINYCQKIKEVKLNPEDQRLIKLQQDYCYRLKYFQYLIKGNYGKESFEELFESHPIQEFKWMYDFYRAQKQKSKLQLFREITKLPFIIDYCKRSRNVKASFYVAKIFEAGQGTISIEQLKIKEPLLNVFEFVPFQQNLQRPSKQKLSQFYVQIQRPQYLSLCPAKIVLFSQTLPPKEFFRFLINYFTYFTNEQMSNYKYYQLESVAKTIFQIIKTIQISPQPFFNEKLLHSSKRLFGMWEDIMKSIFERGIQIAKSFEGSLLCLYRKFNEALAFFMKQYWKARDANSKIVLMDHIISLRKYVDERLAVKFSETICHFKQNYPVIGPNLISQFFNYLLSTVEAYCEQKKYGMAFNNLVGGFSQIKTKGKNLISKEMRQIIQFFCQITPFKEVIRIIKQIVLNKSLQVLDKSKSFDFYFGFFYYVFKEAKKQLANKEAKRILILSVYGRSKFQNEFSFKAEAFYRKQFNYYFPIEKQRRKRIFMKIYCTKARNLCQWEEMLRKIDKKNYLTKIIQSKVQKYKVNLKTTNKPFSISKN